MKTERQRVNGLRWAVRAVLWLGILVSIAANVLHANANPISQAIAAWPPLALFLTVELISRVPGTSRARTAGRVGATSVIAGIAAWVSYWHMQGVAERYGESQTSAYLIPFTVDGVVVVASICLVEIGARLTTLDKAEAAAERATTEAAAAATARAAARAQAPRGVRAVNTKVDEPSIKTEAPAPAKVALTKPAAEATRADDSDPLDASQVAALREQCLKVGRILPRDQARAFLGCKTNSAGHYLKAVRDSLGLPAGSTTIPREVIERESV